jgi:rRNA maturation protein Nop10
MGRDGTFKDVKKCDKCGYYNLKQNWQVYGTCTRCGAVIDSKAKFEYEMVTRLRLWKGKFK